MKGTNRMFRKMGLGAAAVLTAGALAIGCSDDGDTNVIGGSFRPGNFPGGSVDQNNLANDKRAFSNAGQGLSDLAQVFWNVSNGSAIAAFVTESNSIIGPPVPGQQGALLYVAYFNGTTWSAPVELRGLNADHSFGNAGVNGLKVLWLNTAGATDPEAAARNGDAIVLFTRDDQDPTVTVGGTTEEDANRRLYGSYFNVSEANALATPTTQGGFQTVPTPIDFDNQRTSANDPNVTGFGFASDSLHCSHQMGPGTDPIDSGDPTTYVHILYRKDPRTGTASPTNNRLWSVQFDLTQADDVLPTADSGDVIALPAGIDGASAEDVSPNMVVHNGHVFYHVENVDDTNSTDQVLVASVFTTDADSDEFVVSSTPRLDDSPDVSVTPNASNVYGADHGLASTYFIFTETGFQDNGTTGNRASNRDVMLGELQVSATGVTTVGAGSPLEIDAFNGLIDLTDVTGSDNDGDPIRDGVNGEVNLGVQSRINRTGSYIAVMWTQDQDDVTDLNPASAAVGTLLTNDVPFVTVIQTRLDAADARDLVDSVPVAGPEQLGGLVSTFEDNNSTGDVQADATNLVFQEGLVQGEAQSAGDGECDRGCSFQGNNLRMSALFEQLENQTGTTPDDNVLYLNSFTTILGTAAADAPEIDLSGVSTVDELDADYTLSFDAFAIDAGDATLTTTGTPVPAPQAGRVLVFFRSNGNNPEAGGATGGDGVTGNFAEPRLYVAEQLANGSVGDRELVSSDPLTGRDDAFLLDAIQGTVLVPVNEDTVGSPNHVGTTSFVFWTENQDLPGGGLRLMTRSHSQAASTQANPAVTLVDRFTPPLPDSAATGNLQPVAIDNQTSGDLLVIPSLLGPSVDNGVFIGRDGNTVGVYFAEDQHIYFSDSSGTANDFDMENGVGAPQLVDNDADFGTTVIFYDVSFPPECNNLRKSQVLFSRLDLSLLVNGVRLWIRGHD